MDEVAVDIIEIITMKMMDHSLPQIVMAMAINEIITEIIIDTIIDVDHTEEIIMEVHQDITEIDHTETITMAITMAITMDIIIITTTIKMKMDSTTQMSIHGTTQFVYFKNYLSSIFLPFFSINFYPCTQPQK